jgi:hypothetical protein
VCTSRRSGNTVVVTYVRWRWVVGDGRALPRGDTFLHAALAAFRIGIGGFDGPSAPLPEDLKRSLAAARNDRSSRLTRSADHFGFYRDTDGTTTLRRKHAATALFAMAGTCRM